MMGYWCEVVDRSHFKISLKIHPHVIWKDQSLHAEVYLIRYLLGARLQHFLY